jgi:hypothetical protein
MYALSQGHMPRKNSFLYLISSLLLVKEYFQFYNEVNIFYFNF